MNAVMQFLQTTFGPLIFIFTASNLAAMGLQVKMPEVVVALRNKKFMALIFVWGWVFGPAFGYLITKVIPLAEPYVIVVLLTSLAPCAPFLQQMVGKARGDMGFAGALIPLVAGRHGGVDAIDGPPAYQRADDQHLVARETASRDNTPAVDDRSGDPALHRKWCNQDLPGG
jgi:Sodium Bile acid symporter family